MINMRHALLRQAQEYFHTHLLGTVNWDDVMVDKPIPIPSVRGQREQGKVKDLVVMHFDGFRLEMLGPFEDEKWPQGCVWINNVYGDVDYFKGPLDAASWEKVADFVKEHLKGDGYGRISSGEDWGR